MVPQSKRVKISSRNLLCFDRKRKRKKRYLYHKCVILFVARSVSQIPERYQWVALPAASGPHFQSDSFLGEMVLQAFKLSFLFPLAEGETLLIHSGEAAGSLALGHHSCSRSSPGMWHARMPHCQSQLP